MRASLTRAGACTPPSTSLKKSVSNAARFVGMGRLMSSALD